MLKMYSLLLLLLLPCLTKAQTDSNSWLPAQPPHYSFISYDDNVISKQHRLDSFLIKLVNLKHTQKGKVNVIHIGDSHLQADGITSVVRNGFQDFFGDAGRGLVFPYQLANTNAPHDIQSNSNTTWKSNRLTSPDKPIPTGISGYGIHAASKNATVKMHLKETDGKQAYFNRMVFFLCNDSVCYRVTDSNLSVPIVINTSAHQSPGLAIVNTEQMLTGFELGKVSAESESNYSFYGVSLENKDAAGVLYHAIGVNGARYDQFLQNKLFWEQLHSLNGDLFIISLGTNEAQNQYLNEQTVAGICDSFAKMIHKIAPNAPILITTPCGSYFKQKPNKAILKITDAFKKYCENKNMPYWDAYNITGGLQGTPAWKKFDLISHDLIHYNNAGYQLQGSLLLNALAKSYNNYEKSHPWKPAKTANSPKPAVLISKPTIVVNKTQSIQNEVVKIKFEPAKKENAPTNVTTQNPPTTSIPPTPEPVNRKSKIEVKYED